jgi:rubrerythrin
VKKKERIKELEKEVNHYRNGIWKALDAFFEALQLDLKTVPTCPTCSFPIHGGEEKCGICGELDK